MTEHLPECPVEKRLRSGKTVSSQTCICDALRACEARVVGDALSQARAREVNGVTFAEAWALVLRTDQRQRS